MMVSICIPVFNMESCIERCIKSALDQTYQDLEIIVTDNQSTDRTYDIAKSITDSRLCVVRNEKNLGAYGNHNRCLEIAKGEWVKFLHGDDELLPNCISQMAASMGKCPENLALMGCGAIVHDQNDLESQRTFVPSEIIIMKAAHVVEFVREGNFYGTPTMTLVHRTRLLAVGGFDLSMDPFSDGDCWINLRRNYPSAYLPMHLVIIRDDPPESLTKRIRDAGNMFKHTFRQVNKWYSLDEEEAVRPFRETFYGEWLCNETFRFWDLALYRLALGRFELFRILWQELSNYGLRTQSFLFYAKHRLTMRGSTSFRRQPWPMALSHLKIHN